MPLPVNQSTSVPVNYSRIILIIGGLLLLICCIWLAVLSPQFDVGQPEIQMPIKSVVSIMVAAGFVYFVLVLSARKAKYTRLMCFWVLGIGLAMRLVMFPSTPILEDDHFRYLWDGGVTAQGFNPYRYAPLDMTTSSGEQVPTGLKELAESSGGVTSNINYPWLRTVYPPLAQAAFAAAHSIAPWSITAWRLLLAVFDLATLCLLWRVGLPFLAVVIYWLNPLLVKEIYNSAHLDILMFPFLVAAAACIHRERYITATTALGIAAGIKLWPGLLLPIVWRRISSKPGSLVASLAITAVAVGFVALPYLYTGVDRSSGLVAYSRYWEMNDALYLVIKWIAHRIGEVWEVAATVQPLLPRAVFAILVAMTCIWAATDRYADPAGRFLIVICVLFLLSPTQFPWYYLWMLPFLAWRPNSALILYTALLPFYYLRPALELKGHVHIFDHVWVWVEHTPVLLWLAGQRIRKIVGP